MGGHLLTASLRTRCNMLYGIRRRALLALVCLACSLTHGALGLGDKSSWFGFPGRGRSRGGSRGSSSGASGGMKPVLQMPYRTLHRHMLQLSDDAPAGANDSVATQVAEFNPCQEQTMARTQPYLVGVLLWPGGHVRMWLNATGGVQNPCTNATFAAQLAADGNAFVAVFRLKVEDLALLRIDVSGRQRLATLTSPRRVETAVVYNQYAISTPRVITSYSADNAGATGFVVYLPLVVTGEMSLSAFLAPPSFRTMFTVLDQATCTRCTFLQDAYNQMLRQGTPYFSSPLIDLSIIPPGLFDFQCINNVSCAWGLGWCTACLKFSLDRAVLTNYDVESLLVNDPNTFGMTPAKLIDFREAVLSFENICVTLCSTLFAVGWAGVDQFGQQLSSATMFGYVNGFDFMMLFPHIYGLNATLLRKLVRDVENSPPTDAGGRQEEALLETVGVPEDVSALGNDSGV